MTTLRRTLFRCSVTTMRMTWLSRIPCSATAVSSRTLATVHSPRILCALRYTYPENVLEIRGPHRAAHIAAAEQSVLAGNLIAGGAFANPVDGALLLFKNREDAVRFAEKDPYVLNGVATSWDVREWTVVVGDVSK